MEVYYIVDTLYYCYAHIRKHFHCGDGVYTIRITVIIVVTISVTRVNISVTRVNISVNCVNISVTRVNISVTHVNISVTRVNISVTCVNISVTRVNISVTRVNISVTVSILVPPVSILVSPVSILVPPVSILVSPVCITPLNRLQSPARSRHVRLLPQQNANIPHTGVRGQRGNVQGAREEGALRRKGVGHCMYGVI